MVAAGRGRNGLPAGPANQPDSRDASDPALRALDDPCAGSLLDYRVNTSVARGGKRGPRASEAKASRTPWWSAARRAGPRHGPAVPSDEGTGPTARRPRVRRSAPALCRRSAPLAGGATRRNFAKPGRTAPRQRVSMSTFDGAFLLSRAPLQPRHPEVRVSEASEPRRATARRCNIRAVHPSRLAIARRRRASTRLWLAPQDDGEECGCFSALGRSRTG